MRILLLVCLIPAIYGRFFDSCPSKRASIGACLAGLCPAGSECMNGFCCKIRTSTTDEVSSEDIKKLSRCKNGRLSLGECINESCPPKHKCEKGFCCPIGLPPIRVTMIPVEITKPPKEESITIIPRTKPSVIPEAEEVEETAEEVTKSNQKKVEEEEEEEKRTTTKEDISEFESMKLTVTKPASKENGEDGKEEVDAEEVPGDKTDEESVTELVIEEREEIGDVTTISTTISSSPSTTSEDITTIKPVKVPKKRKVKKVKTTTAAPSTTTTASEEAEEVSVEEEEVETSSTTTIMTTSSSATTIATNSSEVTSKPEEEVIQENVCPVGDSIGECISNQCPEGHGCYRNRCCILTPQINCIDILNGCLAHLCEQRGYNEFMTKNCARTCAKCDLSDNKDTLDIKGCKDRRGDCKEWAQEGFCQSTLYTTKQKLKMCGKTCNLC